MAAKCKKCDPHEICEECPEWIFTLADLIMCMMGLFVLLWVLKPSPTPPALGAVTGEPNKQQAKLTEQVIAIRQAFGGHPDPSSKDPIDIEWVQRTIRREGDKGKGTADVHVPAADGTDALVQTVREGKLSIVGTRVEFEQGESKLSEDDTKSLNQIARQIIGMRFIVIIKGHAARDDFGDKAMSLQFMDISLKRAQAVADYLVSCGVSPDILRVQGCSTFEPVKERAYTADAQKLNRRVEVYSTDLIVRDLQNPGDAAKPVD